MTQTRRQGELSLRARTAIALIVAVVWAVSVLADIFLPDYQPPQALHALMLVVVGAIFGYESIRRKNGGNAGGGDRGRST